MIITKAPFRISFFGGGSDLAEFYTRHPGAVLSTTINQYMYISSHRFFHENKIRVKYSQTETVDDVRELKHPILREVLQRFHVSGALEVTSVADVPGGTGLGSSSAFTAALLHNLYVRSGKHVTKERLAEEACDIEINRLKEPIGKQDQYSCALGGMNVLRFEQDGSVRAEGVNLKRESQEELERHLYVFYTGTQRATSAILGEQKRNMASGAKVDLLRQMVDLVPQGRDALYAGDWARFGGLLHEGWMLKRELASGISNPDVDGLYARARSAGAWGGKLLGAGGGGFLLLCCPPERAGALRKELAPLRELAFRLEREGSKVIYFGEE